jgi:hypothetical protein
MKGKYKRIIDLIEENRGKTFHLERKYLTELIDDGWYLDEEDALPKFTKLVATTIRYWGVSLKYEKEILILNISPFLFIPKNFR